MFDKCKIKLGLDVLSTEIGLYRI